MRTRIAVAALAGFAAGVLVLAFVVYPPAPGWGSDAKWGDIPTWFGAVATFLAVLVALFLPAVQAARQRASKRSVAARLYYDDAERLMTVTIGMGENITEAVQKRDAKDVERVATQAINQALLALDGLSDSADSFIEDEAAKLAHAISAMRAISRRLSIIRRWEQTKTIDPNVTSDVLSLGSVAAKELEIAARAVADAADVLRTHGGRSIVDRGLI